MQANESAQAEGRTERGNIWVSWPPGTGSEGTGLDQNMVAHASLKVSKRKSEMRDEWIPMGLDLKRNPMSPKKDFPLSL